MKAKRAYHGVLLVTVMLLVAAMPLTATDATPPANELAAVKATVTNYIEAYYTSDPARMEASLHPHYLKHSVSSSDGKTRMVERTGLDMVQSVRAANGKVTPQASRVEKITVLDISGDIASAKLETAKWVDYLSLAKVNGEWKIVSVLLREAD